jgi:inner membrane protein
MAQRRHFRDSVYRPPDAWSPDSSDCTDVPSIGHLAVGLAGARIRPAPPTVAGWAWAGLLVVLSYLPDADVLAFRLGIPYQAPFGHRGALHSIAFAALCAAGLGCVARLAKVPVLPVVLTGGLVIASHGILDTFTDGGLGIALLWPFRLDRYFAPWRPIPVAPIGWPIVSRAGLAVMAHEAVLFLPLFIVAAWPARRRRDA